MMVLWVTLLVLHQGYSLVPVIPVQLGESVTFTCVNKDLGSKEVHWYKQTAGNTLRIIVTLWQSKSQYGPEFPESRLKVEIDRDFSKLTILRTIREDEGLYHCRVSEWIHTDWSGTYLLVKGNTERTSDYTVIQEPTVSDPVRPGDSVTLQCSVVSDSENKTCPGDHSVYWFRAGSDKSHPGIIYTDGNDECEKRPDSLKSCVYSFSKTVSSSDAGTYYCAVATCGQILFGNGTKLQIEGPMCFQISSAVIFVLCAFLTLTFVICTIEKNKCDCCNAPVARQQNSGGQKAQGREEDAWIYSAAIFTIMKSDGGIKDVKAAGRARVYAAVKAFGLD